MGKLVYVIIDGLGDLPVSLLKDKTPLEAAEKPNIDYFAEKGSQGLAKIYKVDHENFLAENGSNFGGITLLGQDPRDTSWRRGPIEAVGMEMKFREGKDLALRCNLAYVNLKGEVEDRRAGRISNEDGAKFVEEIKDKIKYPAEFEIKHALRHRVITILKSSQPLGEEIVASDPLKADRRLRNVMAMEQSEPNTRSANLLRVFEERVHEVLRASKLNSDRRGKGGYPITHLITRGAGINLPKLPIYDDFAAICTSPVEYGLARLAKMKILGLTEPGEDHEKDTQKTLELLKEHWSQYDKFLIFIKGPDTFAHDGNSMKKKKAIETIDQTIFAFLKENLNLKTDVLCITSDHATPCKLMRHAADPIPLLISGKIQPDNNTTFSEKYCEQGGLGQVWGYDIMKMLYKLYRN